MDYEYAFMTAIMALPPGMTDLTTEEVSHGIGAPLGRFGETLQTAIPAFQGGGWEVVSHNLARLDGHLLVSLLLRRPPQQG